MTDHPLALAGQYGSPYTLKMRAVLRYRQIPFRWVLRGSKWDDLPAPPVPIIPVIAYPEADGSHGEVTVDSSPQILRLEGEFAGRSVVPPDPATIDRRLPRRSVNRDDPRVATTSIAPTASTAKPTWAVSSA